MTPSLPTLLRESRYDEALPELRRDLAMVSDRPVPGEYEVLLPWTTIDSLELQAILEALIRLIEQTRWEPIAYPMPTCEDYLIWDGEEVHLAHLLDNGTWNGFYGVVSDPTHYMPLPLPPKPKAGEKE